jgi:hypothetical protein
LGKRNCQKNLEKFKRNGFYQRRLGCIGLLTNQAGIGIRPIDLKHLIEAFAEINNDTKSVDGEGLLLKNKQSKTGPPQNPHTEAIYIDARNRLVERQRQHNFKIGTEKS